MMKRPDLSFEFPDRDVIVEWYCDPPRRRTLYCKATTMSYPGEKLIRHSPRGLYTFDWPAVAIACTRTLAGRYTSVRWPALLSRCYEEDAVVGYWGAAKIYDMPGSCCLGPTAASAVETGRMHPVDAFWFSAGAPPVTYCDPSFYEHVDHKLRMFSAAEASRTFQHGRLTF